MARRELIHERLTRSAIGAFFKVYNTLGFGFLEKIYVMALERELQARGHRVAREVWVPVFYEGNQIGRHRLDMIVDEVLVIETKSTYRLRPGDKRQVYSCLRSTNLEVGLLFHFGPRAEFYRFFFRHSKLWHVKGTESESSVPSEQSV
jgi:GxxExxY protein